MNDAPLVRGLQATANLKRDVQHSFERKSRFPLSGSQPVSQGFALQQFHHQEGLAPMLTELVNAADVGVVQ